MKKQIEDTVVEIVDEIISQLPLRERASLAKMNKVDVEVLQHVFDLYVKSKIDSEDEEYANIMQRLWKRLGETHRLKVVK